MRTIDLTLLTKYRQELMGFSAIGILMCHACGNDVMMPAVLWQICSFGQIGVSLFFFLSGMGMFYSLRKEKKGIIYWYKNRYIKLLVPYLIMSIPYFLWQNLRNDDGLTNFLLDVSTLSYFLKGRGVWFVSAIIPLYFIIPWWHRLLDRKRWNWIPTFIVFIVLVYFAEWKHLGEIAFFFLGYWLGKPVSDGKQIRVFWVVVVPTALYLVCREVPFLNWMPRSLLLVFPFLFVAALCFDKFGRVVKVPFKFMGKISLESYMANVMLPSVFALVPWVVNGINLNAGNRLQYTLVVFVGIMIAYYVHYLSQRVIKKLI